MSIPEQPQQAKDLSSPEAEYRALFAAADFQLTQIIPTASEMSVIEGVRV